MTDATDQLDLQVTPSIKDCVRPDVPQFASVLLPDERHDLTQIPEDTRYRLLKFMELYTSGGKLHASLEQSHVEYPEIVWAREQSKTFKMLWEAARQTRREQNVHKIEEAQTALACGEFAVSKSHYAPSTSAAALYLQSNDPRYKQGAQTPATAVNIQLNI